MCEVCQVAVKISHDLDSNVDKNDAAGSLKLEMSAFLQKQINKALLDTEQTLPQNVQTFDKIHSVSFSPNIQRPQGLPTPVRQTQLSRSELFSCIQGEDSSLASKSPQIELGDEFLKFMAQQDEEHLEQLLYTLGCSPIKASTASLKAQRLPSACPCHSTSLDCPQCLLSESPTHPNIGHSRHTRHLRNLGMSLCGTQKKTEKSRSGGRHASKHADCSTHHHRASSKYSKYKAFSRSLKFDTQNLETLSAVASIQGDLDSSMAESLLQPPQKQSNKKDASNKPKAKRKSYTLPHKSDQQSEVKPDTRCVHVLPQTSGSDSETNSCDSLTTESKFGVLKKQVMPDGSNIEHLFLVPTDWLSNKVEVKMVPSESAPQQEQVMLDQGMLDDSEVYGTHNLHSNATSVSENYDQVIQTSCEGHVLEVGQPSLDCNKATDNFKVLCTKVATDETDMEYERTDLRALENDTNIVSNTSDVSKVDLLPNDKIASRPDVDPDVTCKQQMPTQNSDTIKELKTKDTESSDQLSEYDGVLVSGNEPCVILMTKNLDCIDETVLTNKPMHQGPFVNDLKSASSSDERLHVHKSQGQSSLTEETTEDKSSSSCAIDIAMSKAGLSTGSNTEAKMGKALAVRDQPKAGILVTDKDLKFSEALKSPSRDQSRVVNSINVSGCKTGVPYNSFTTRVLSNYSDGSSASNSCSASNSYTSCESDFCCPPFEKVNLVNMKLPGDTNSLASAKRSNKVALSLDHAVSKDDQRWKKWRLLVGDENVEYTNRAAQKSASSNASCESHSHFSDPSRAHAQNMQCFYHRLHPEFLLKELEKLVSSTNSKLELTVLLQKLSELHEIINLRSSGNAQMVFNESLISCESEKELFYGIMMAAASVISFVKAYQVTVKSEGKINQNCFGLISFFDKIIRHGVILITKMLFGYNHLLYTHQEKCAAVQNMNMNSPQQLVNQRDNTTVISNSIPCGHEEMTHVSNQHSVAKFQKVIAYIRELQRAQNSSNTRCENSSEELTNTEMMSGNQTYAFVSSAESSHSGPDKSENPFHDNEMNTQTANYSSQIQRGPECSVKCTEYHKASRLENHAEVKTNDCDEEEKVIGIVSDVALNVEVGNATASSPDEYQSDDSHIPLKNMSTLTATLSTGSLKDQCQSSAVFKKEANKTKSRKSRTSKRLKPTPQDKKSSKCEFSQSSIPCPGASQGKKGKKEKVSKANAQGKSAPSRTQKSIPESNERKRQHPEDSAGDCDESSSSKKSANKTTEVRKVNNSNKKSKVTNKTQSSKKKSSTRKTCTRKRKKSQFSVNLYSSSSEEVIRPPRRRGFQHTDTCYKIFTTVFNHKRSDEFCNEILSEHKPDYYKVVKRGMWLNLIAQKLRQGIYETLEEFVDDFRLVFKNCRSYYPPDSYTYESGEICSQLFEQQMKEAFPEKSF
ncbi:uncharacterized protein LOC121384469 [Gigantopelta aegis]|uniref:uncharacterized protein LOC121384469 n=1 Tax=Gigantopelta aegis TaxID=1735272 RepID=UPI001B88BF0E|nr:uncharacterized protein LOC121384469 [Gigantopelta aegis]